MENLEGIRNANPEFYLYFITFFLYVVINSIDLQILKRRPFNCEVCFCFWASVIGSLILLSFPFLFLNFAFNLLLISLLNNNYKI